MDNITHGVPDTDAFLEMAEAGLALIPGELRRHIRPVRIEIQDLPDKAILDEMSMDSPYDLLGLYTGVDLTRKSIFDPGPDMDSILLFRLPLWAFYRSQSENSLEAIVAHVIIHEVGHHFGMSDADMERLEAMADAEEAAQADNSSST